MIEAPIKDLPIEKVPVLDTDNNLGIYDLYRLYIQEIGNVPLLTAVEEQSLARYMREGEEEQTKDALVKDHYVIRKGISSRNSLIEANLRLVVSIAARYTKRGLDIEDLTQEGNLGLIRAVDKFDPDLGFRFSTYATWWIKQSVTRGIADKSRTIRIPVHAYEALGSIYKAKRAFEQTYGREPNLEELSLESNTSVERLKQLISDSVEPISLNQPYGNDSGELEKRSLEDIVEDVDVPVDIKVSEKLANNEFSDYVKEKLKDQKRALDVLQYRFGGFDGRRWSLEEVGKVFGITRERVRQIEAKALKTLRDDKKRIKIVSGRE